MLAVSRLSGPRYSHGIPDRSSFPTLTAANLRAETKFATATFPRNI
jgi:hypothetical protein